MGIDLPTGQRVFALVLRDRLVGISAGGIGRQLAKKQYIFRASDSHLGTILAHLGIAQTVGLIVFPHHVGIDRNASHISEAMLHVMKYSHFVERVPVALPNKTRSFTWMQANRPGFKMRINSGVR